MAKLFTGIILVKCSCTKRKGKYKFSSIFVYSVNFGKYNNLNKYFYSLLNLIKYLQEYDYGYKYYTF